MSIALQIAHAEKEAERLNTVYKVHHDELSAAKVEIRELSSLPTSPDGETRLVGLERFVQAKLEEIKPFQSAAAQARARVNRLETELTRTVQRLDAARVERDRFVLPENTDTINQMLASLKSELGGTPWAGARGEIETIADSIGARTRDHTRAESHVRRLAAACAPLPKSDDLPALPKPAKPSTVQRADMLQYN